MPASTHAVLPPLLLLLLLPPLLLLSPSSAASAALHPDALALLAFKAAADLDNRLRFSPNTSSSSSTPHHCSWPGVACSSSSPGITPRVTRLVLESQSLRGTLPPVALSRLDQLRILSLKNNSLSGPIPDLSALPDLKSLYLSSNALSGPIPDTLTSLHRLRTLDLSSNNLSGPIPPSLILLDRLADLLLDRNALQDLLPPFNQTSLRSFNVSGNNLSGPVPVTTALLSFSASAFADNPGLCGEVVRKECHHYGSFFKNGESNGQFGSSDQQADPTGRAKPGAGQLQGILANSSGGSPHDGGAGGWRRRKSVALGLTVAGGCALAAVLLCALLALRNTRRKGTRGLSPQKGALAAAEAADAALESLSYNNDHDDVGNNDDHSGLGIVVVHNSGAEMVAAATSVAEDKVKRLGKSGVLVFCAGEAPVYSLEQLMRASAELLGRGLAGTTYKAVLDNRLIVCVKRVDASKMSTTGKEAFEQHMEVVGRLRHPNIVPLRAYFQAKEERLLVYDYQPNGSLYSLIHGSKSSRAKPLHWTSCLKIAEDVAQGLAYIHQASRLVHGNLKATNVLLGSDFEACLTDNCLAFLFEPPEVEEEPGYRAPEVHNSNRNLTPKSDTYAFGVLLLELLTGKPPLQHSFLAATDLAAWVRSVRENEGAEDERLMMLVDIATECLSSSPESRPTMWQVLKMIQEVKEADMVENELD